MALSTLPDRGRGHVELAWLLDLVAPDEGARLAGKLIDEFGSLGRVLSVSGEAIGRVTGEASPVLAAVSALRGLLQGALSTHVEERPLLGSPPALIDYLRLTIGHTPAEVVRVLFLDRSMRLIRDELVGLGTVGAATVYPREVVKRALELNATGLILAHNHPTGATTPSLADRRLTTAVCAIARDLEITVYDHIIVGAEGYSSFRELGLV